MNVEADEQKQTAAHSDQPTSASPPSKRRWRWVLLGVAVVVALHVPILQSVGEFLTVAPSSGAHDAAVIVSGDHRLQVVADLFAAGLIDDVWLIPEHPTYLVTAGVLSRQADVARAGLLETGVPRERLQLLDAEAAEVSDVARVVKAKLEQNADVTVLVVCARLQGRHVRYIFDDVLGEKLAGRVGIRGLPDERFDLRRWWRSRSGLKEVFGQACSLGFTWMMGTQPRAPLEVDPGVLEKHLERIAKEGEGPCYEF